MKSQTSLVEQQTRLREWAEQIRDCNNRPHGMTVDEWCQGQGITKANYYWRLRKVREELLKITDPMPAFAELKAPAPGTALAENNTPLLYSADVLSEVFGFGDMEYFAGIKLFNNVIDRLGVDIDLQRRYEVFDRIYEEGMREKKFEQSRNSR